MALRFLHFLLLLTAFTLASFAFTFTHLLQLALAQAPNFSSALLRQVTSNGVTSAAGSGAFHELVDFVSQVPPRKLAFLFLTHHPAHVLLLLVGIANALLIGGYILQRALFAKCTPSELKAARETCLQFVVFRLIFLGSILETSLHTAAAPADHAGAAHADAVSASPATSAPFAPGSGSTRELFVWLLWFAVIGFIRWFLVLLRERFQSAQSSPHATIRTFVKYLVVTLAFSAANLLVGLGVVALLYRHTTWTVISLLVFENVVMIASCVKIAMKYGLYIRTLQRALPWEERGSTLYYAEMACEIVVQAITLAHLLHIWSHYGLSFSLLDLFLFLHVRQLSVGVWRNVGAMRTYSKAIAELNDRFPDATPEELRQLDDVCSICRDSMGQAKRLPCNHLFHRSCLQQWIEHQSFCPSCRAPLVGRGNAAAAPAVPRPLVPPADLAAQQAGLAAFAAVAQRQREQAAALGNNPAQSPANAATVPGSGVAVGSGQQAHSPASLHAMGLRNRFGAQPASSGVLGPAPGVSSPAHSHGSSPGHGHSHTPGHHSHAHSHGGGAQLQTQPLFRIDTSRFSWLPNFSLEVQSVREGAPNAGGGPATAEGHMMPAESQAQQEGMPPLEPIPSSLEEHKQAAATASSSPDLPLSPISATAAAPSASASAPTATASSSSASLREKIHLATQKRLQENAARDAKFNTANSTTTSGEPVAASSSSSAPADPAAPSHEGDGSMLEIPAPLPPMTTSPLLLSQADADANLARELQREEELLAAQEQAARANGGAFGRFFTSL